VYREAIARVLAYIEENLQDDREGVLENSALARVAGYSEYHFLRIFRQTVHLTPAAYIRKRRITEIVRRIGQGSRPMSDIAFAYGFNSKENFTRAFKKEHHILPTEFRTAGCSLRLYEPFRFEEAAPRPAVSLGYLEEFSLTVFPSDEDFPPNFWNKYNTGGKSVQLTGGGIAEDYGVMKWNASRKRLDYYIGVRTELAGGNPSGTVQLTIPGGLYAMFDTPAADQHGFVAAIRQTWDWIRDVWLPENGYRRTGGFELESYVESSRKYTERIYIPIEKEK